MLIGYVSDEHFSAIADAQVEFTVGGLLAAVVRSTPSGALYADIPPGPYRVTLARDGFGSKRVEMTVDPESPYQFRMLSHSLCGYAWPKWLRSGERCEFRVHSIEAFRLSLWRYGREKELIRLLGWQDEHGPQAMRQILPDGDFTQTGTHWNRIGFTNPHSNGLIQAPERSGLYYLHAETATGAFFAFPWVVAPARPSARIAVLAATNSWNAYNNWGGRSNYVNAAGLPPEPTVYARQDLNRYQKGPFTEWLPNDDAFLPLSFERPELFNSPFPDEGAADPIKGRLQSSMAPGEWRLLAWLEREGFAYDYYSEQHLDNGLLELDAYEVLIFGVHPEYWTRRMYLRLKEWVQERGGRLLYLGGNGVNAEVQFVGDSAMCIHSHLKSEGGTFSMRDEAGEILESRFHRNVESEANLLGVVSTDSGVMTAAPYRAIQPDHWVFAGTGLEAGDLFGEASQHERCPGGASGYETDKRSRYSPQETVLLAKGENPDEGGAEMVIYELASGGACFSASSITWVSSLMVDENVSRITANVIRRFLR
ncbi:carboxypeptidase-like regulatory domain-containing protein [Bryobacter aggregatus]|uniref:carboxypeptidase-like regulatory domain-containing protein n=1 Tax=Bryobacter aggregatus TaxID=360054 RepID=UPI0004E1D6E8|nr:carboxypeptidase-like regulatory domain-containing protein [Bryobacter aggregatus]